MHTAFTILDKLVKNMKNSDPVFMQDYFSARQVINRGGRAAELTHRLQNRKRKLESCVTKNYAAFYTDLLQMIRRIYLRNEYLIV